MRRRRRNTHGSARCSQQVAEKRAMKTTKRVLRATFFLAVILGLGAYIFWKDLHKEISSLALGWWLLACAFAWASMTLNATIAFWVRLGSLPALRTLVSFPVCQNIAGYLFPFQGSLAFSSFYFLKVHGLSISRTVTLNVLLTLASASLFGLFGLALAAGQGGEESAPTLLFLLIAAAPAMLLMLAWALPLGPIMDKPGDRPAGRAAKWLAQAIEDLNGQARTVLSKPRILSTYAARLGVIVFWYGTLNLALETHLGWLEICYLVLAVEASIVLKLTPGNWGVSQASAAVALELIGRPPEDGVLIVTTAMLSVLLLDIAVGYFTSRQIASRLTGTDAKSLYRTTTDMD
jgi:hypothetical protein